MRIHRQVLALVCLGFILTGCAWFSKPGPAQETTPTAIPTPVSQQMGEFIWQQDGDYAYAMLRPANWQSADNVIGRTYFPGAQDDQMRLALNVVNLKNYADNIEGGGTDVRWTLYRQHPNLAGWSDAVNKVLWNNDNVQLERNLDHARVYSIRWTAGHVRLVAYIIDQRTPLELTLDIGGEQALLEQIRQNGLLDDFVTIAESMRTAPVQPGFSSPPLQWR